MNCRKCKKEIPENSKFCNHCGTKQEFSMHGKRGNGEGSVYKTASGKWKAEVTLGYEDRVMPDGTVKTFRKNASKSNFNTKKEALEYLPRLRHDVAPRDMHIKFKVLYSKWLDIHSEKVTASTINCYKSAYKYYSPLYYIEFAKLRTEDLQKCIDACPYGRRTKENMKALGTCLYKYAMQLDLVDRNYAEYIYIKKEKKTEKTAFSKEQIGEMWKQADTVPELKYILVLCYTGLRLGEMLSAKTENYHKDEGYFITGSKTKAGKDRIITISKKLLSFFEEFGKGEYLFFAGKKPLSDKKFRNEIFYPALQKVGMDETSADGAHLLTPHCCRHTFATLMKNVDAPATDKQKLIGHSKFEMTAHYTHTDLESLKKITDNL